MRLSVPARPETVHVVRSVVGGVAAFNDASIEALEDLRLCADEACAHLISAVRGERLYLDVEPEGPCIEVVASIDAPPGEWPPPDARESLAWLVLSALADEVGFVRHEGRPAIRFCKRIAHD